MIPFLPMFKRAILSGAKTCTARTRKYGEVGDDLRTPWAGVKLRIIGLSKVPLWAVENRYRDEGCSSPEEFVRIWKTIHPRNPYDRDMEVWLHEFRLVK